MPDLLLELFSEEIPARMQRRAADDLERMVNVALIEAGFSPEWVKGFATPRRLTVAVAGLPARQPDRREEKKGPRVGAPEKAVVGFLKSAGLSSLDQCEKREDKKGAYYVAVIDKKGRDSVDIIAKFVPAIVRGFSWPKSMRWGAGELRWVRPLHSVLCAFNGEIVDFEIDGIKSGDITHGHRFMAPGEIRTRNFDDYVSNLRAAKVVLDADERKEIIAEDATTLCKAQGFELVEDDGLLTEVAGLAEWPVAMMGVFEEKFLALPDEVLTASMRGHQKYFSVKDPKNGALANRFICIANIEAFDGGAAMRQGYERVLTARLSDAWYLYNQDLKTPLEERVKDLHGVTFFEGLGSIGDKAERIAALAEKLAPAMGADAKKARFAGRLAKADLVSGMVYEFPELQGVMGGYYAIEEGIDADIAEAIRDHYKPAGQDDAAPIKPLSAAVALADKIDTLTAFWAIDKKPTGSSDPFALRRAALGVIRIVLENGFRLALAEDDHDLLAFFHERLKVYLRDKGHRYDAIDAVLKDADGALLSDLVLIIEKLKALEAFLKGDEGENLAAAFKRAVNILKAEEKKDALPETLSVDQDLLTAAQEKSLFAALCEAERKIEKALAKEDFTGAMGALADLRAPVDHFFDKVTVNAEDEALRANRLAMLLRFRASAASVADFAALEG